MASQRITDNLERGLEWGNGRERWFTEGLSLLHYVYATEHTDRQKFRTVEALEEGMRKVQPDLRKWELSDE